MKNSIITLIFIIFSQSCSNNPRDRKNSKSENLNNYTITLYQDKFNSSTNKFIPNNLIDTVKAENDTVAYLNALKSFYNKKIIERKKFHYGEPKSFLIVDTKGIDLKVKLSDKVINGLTTQVINTPDVKQMIENYQRDSLK